MLSALWRTSRGPGALVPVPARPTSRRRAGPPAVNLFPAKVAANVAALERLARNCAAVRGPIRFRNACSRRGSALAGFDQGLGAVYFCRAVFPRAFGGPPDSTTPGSRRPLAVLQVDPQPCCAANPSDAIKARASGRDRGGHSNCPVRRAELPPPSTGVLLGPRPARAGAEVGRLRAEIRRCRDDRILCRRTRNWSATVRARLHNAGRLDVVARWRSRRRTPPAHSRRSAVPLDPSAARILRRSFPALLGPSARLSPRANRVRRISAYKRDQ